MKKNKIKTVLFSGFVIICGSTQSFAQNEPNPAKESSAQSPTKGQPVIGAPATSPQSTTQSPGTQATPAPVPATPANRSQASTGVGAKQPTTQSITQYKQKTVYDFDDDTVEGDLTRPDGEMVDSRRGSKHSSLVKIRENFIPEMLKSVENL